MTSTFEVTPRPSLRLAAVVATCLAVVVVLADVSSPVRAPIVVLWMLIVPGWAWARRVTMNDRGDVLALSLTLSSVLIVLIAGTMAIIGAWSAWGAFTLLVAWTLAGLLLPARPRRRSPQQRTDPRWLAPSRAGALDQADAGPVR